MGRARIARWAAAVAMLAAAATAPAASGEWTTYHADAARTGVDSSSGTTLPFSPAWQTVDLGGAMYAQPLVYRGLVIVATEHNDVYGLDELTGTAVWHASAGTPVPASALPCGDIKPTVGITSTPVIDPATGTLYVVADTWDGTNAHHQMVAYDALTGAELWSRNVDPPGTTPLAQLQRASLNLDSGRVLFGYGGNAGDCGSYWGWLASVSEDGSSATYWQVPTAKGGAVWATGGPTVDSSGGVYIATGNGAATSAGDAFDWSNAVIRFDSPTSFAAQPSNFFAPANWAALSANDADLGSASPVLVQNGLAYVDGKDGSGYLLSASSLGGIGGQLFNSDIGCVSKGGDAYANGLIYVTCQTGGMRALSVDAGGPSFSTAWTGPTPGNGSPIVAGGLVWVPSYSQSRLYGLNPATGAIVVNQATPAMEHFTSPSASDGQVLLATGNTVEAYTMANGSAATTKPSTTTLASSVKKTQTDALVTLTATVRAAVKPAGTVSFDNGGAPVSGCTDVPLKPSGANGIASCKTSFAAASSPAELAATFTPAQSSNLRVSMSPTVAIVITPGPTKTVVRASPTNPTVGTPTTLTATVTPSKAGPAAPTGTVAFLEKDAVIGSCGAQPLTGAAATCTVTFATSGWHTVTAKYSGDGSFNASTSAGVIVSVRKPG